MKLPSSDELEMYQRWGVTPPSHDEHGTIEEIRAHMVTTNVFSWRLEGNELVAKTNHGIIRQTIPTNYILIDTDEEGLPVFKKVI